MGGKAQRLVESVLFSATQPVSVDDIKEATGLAPKEIRSSLDELMQRYNDELKRESALEIIQAGNKYTMQVKKRYSDTTTMVTRPEIQPNLLKTLALIAFHQPIKQSNLRRMLGPKVYDHVD
jgi:segregation and condensation protein B